jgi:hypothetical protein
MYHTRSDIEKETPEIARKASDADMMMQRARVDQVRALHAFGNSIAVRCRCAPALTGHCSRCRWKSDNAWRRDELRRVAQPEPLKAELRVAETQARAMWRRGNS